MSEDRFRIDSHKLMFHVGRVNEWLKGESVCPIYLEVAPAGSCNHRCMFCALDYLGYKPRFLKSNQLRTTIKQANAMGVKSIMYAGEGEPLLHKDICEIVQYTKKVGIDVAITTNGVLLKKAVSRKLLKYLSWLRISFNAGSSATYSKVHGTSKEDYYAVLQNLKDAVKIKKANKLPTNIGVQLLLIPENVKEVFGLGKLLRSIGVDYLTIKPYSQHPFSKSRLDPKFKYKDYGHIGKKLKEIETKKFRVIFRGQTMERLSNQKDYKHCLGLPFWAYIDASGDIYACSAFLGNKKFCFGNIYKDNFKTIMNSKRRKRILEKASSRLDVTKCREVCRLDKINSYLWELRNPEAHVNFI